MFVEQLLEPVHLFLQAVTPDSWITEARKPENLSVILRDHLLCELKAAQSALFLIRRYAVEPESAAMLNAWLQPYEDLAYRRLGSVDTLRGKSAASKQVIVRADCRYGAELVDKMVLLIKEELHHFYQVLEIMAQKQIPYEPLPASRYAKSMMRHVKHFEPDALVDKLIIGAFIEARSCERFAKLAPYLDEELGRFYLSLLRSEARHYQDYLSLAQAVAGQDISARIAYFAAVEAELITSPDPEFKFHSGVPAWH
ncbi:tRNA-(ms[2]io[6]A)-hydroxylase [Plesiomonas shigelloides]|uniref:tRNA isopentenyl-2-thiomethyl-A-37 hydroxylase MiaE n=1 Tax=Plesiomonas shigelloides TaxID=703 RepID=UPI00143E69D6|nr:tRNA isopentenyl-2-thiomethyl-A-37 hydroxylase MiaE [Plesiomonas shigelloides]QIY07804.1 tRNA-(ms[2]io[6]A)-hydroxylase [Plesiomonas shigelloides]